MVTTATIIPTSSTNTPAGTPTSQPELKPILYIIIPCYNDEVVLSLTAPVFLAKLQQLVDEGLISSKSKILFVNDGSTDCTWEIIKKMAMADSHFLGISQSRNRGHQNAVLAGLMETKDMCDITISIDCDGQDDINAMNEMVRAYWDGAEVVYAVRSKRATDTYFKQLSAACFYKTMQFLGADIIFNHADYRLISAKVLQSFADFHEVNIFLRGLVPLVGYPSATVHFERRERIAGESHYSFAKMLKLACDGITSLSTKPIQTITLLGICVSLLGFFGIIWAIVKHLAGEAITGWASLVCITCFMGGIQLLSMGVIGEYVGKIYLESKHRPRYIISERTWTDNARNWKG